jgi:hypothetical protein
LATHVKGLAKNATILIDFVVFDPKINIFSAIRPGFLGIPEPGRKWRP